MEDIKTSIRHIYHELYSYLEVAPNFVESGNPVFLIESRGLEIVHQLNRVLDELCKLNTDQEFKESMDRFRITAQRNVDAQTYRTKLAGLISNLYSRYFFEEINPPFGNSAPNMIIQQHQNQQQNLNIEFKNTLDKLIKDEKDPKKKQAFEKIKDTVKSTGDIADALSKLGSLVTPVIDNLPSLS
ncbi:MAG: hypothetical protein HRT47_01850 [Candidatus Caenarcaniphilales bacterium]|nr:hypothetical protein [Candidatus Caenarcaniphilales bacterium]